MTLTRVQAQTLRRGATSLAANIDGLINAVDGMVYNIKSTDFAGGAKCDGVTDDTDAIQACWDAITNSPSGQGVAIHPPGISVVTLRSATKGYCVRPRSGVRVFGFGHTIKLKDFSSGNAGGTRAVGQDSGLPLLDAFQMFGQTVDNNKDNQIQTIDSVLGGSITAAGKLSGGQATNTGTITMDTTANYDSAGSVSINGVTVNYTSVDATHLLGCTGGSGVVQADLTPVFQSPAKMSVNSPGLFTTANFYQIGLELVRPTAIVGSVITVSRIQDGTAFNAITVGEAIQTGFSYDQDMACFLGANFNTRTVVMASSFKNAQSDCLNVASNQGARVIGNEMTNCERVGLNFKQADHLVNVANWLHDMDGWAMKAEVDSAGVLQRGNRVTNNEMYNVGGGLSMTQGSSQIVGTLFAQNYLDLQSPSSTYGLNYEGTDLDCNDNDFVNPPAPCIRLSRVTVHAAIRGNRFRNPTDIAATGSDLIAIGGGSGTPPGDISIEDNDLFGAVNCGIGVRATGGTGAGSPYRVSARRNRVISSGRSGIAFFTGDDCSAEENLCYDNGTLGVAGDQAGIRTAATGGSPTKLSVKHNRCIGSANQLEGVRIASATTPDATIESNIFTNCTTGGITAASIANLSGNSLVHLNRALGTTPSPIPTLGVSRMAAVQVAGGSTLFSGTGVPSNAIGADGDFFFRIDGTAAGNTVIYHKEAGAWVPLVTT